MKHEQGFTLIELMISLVLGLIISAAVVQVYVMSVRTKGIQTSSSNLQNASVFGFQKLEDAIRLANLGNNTTNINDTTPLGGIVLGANNIANIGAGLSTAQNAHNVRAATSDGQNGSDQLTISYRNISGRIMTDCEGVEIANDDVVIERYFLNGAVPNIALNCDAGRVTVTNGLATAINNFGDNGQLFIQNIDQFKIMLGIQSGGNRPTIRFLTVNQYDALTGTKPAITAVRIAMISRGGTAILDAEGATQFNMLGAAYQLVDGAQPQVRAVYESNVLLRNARVIYTTR